MGKKKKSKDDVKPFCYYCDRIFADEHILVMHQKAKHFRCLECRKQLNTTQGLVTHCWQVHKIEITAVPAAKPGREAVDIEIFGMAGVPEGMRPGRGAADGDDEYSIKKARLESDSTDADAGPPPPPAAALHPGYPKPFPQQQFPMQQQYSGGGGQQQQYGQLPGQGYGQTSGSMYPQSGSFDYGAGGYGAPRPMYGAPQGYPPMLPRPGVPLPSATAGPGSTPQPSAGMSGPAFPAGAPPRPYSGGPPMQPMYPPGRPSYPPMMPGGPYGGGGPGGPGGAGGRGPLFPSGAPPPAGGPLFPSGAPAPGGGSGPLFPSGGVGPVGGGMLFPSAGNATRPSQPPGMGPPSSSGAVEFGRSSGAAGGNHGGGEGRGDGQEDGQGRGSERHGPPIGGRYDGGGYMGGGPGSEQQHQVNGAHGGL